MAGHEQLSNRMDEVCVALQGCVDVGGFCFDEISEHLEAIVETGVTVRNFETEASELANCILEAFKLVLEDVQNYMAYQCEDLKEFNNYANFAHIAMSLLNPLVASLSTPGQTDANFELASERTPPVDCGLKLVDLLEKDPDNPLKVALKNDPERSSHFIKWDSVVDSVLAQFLFIEAFANGYLHNGNMDGAVKLKKRIEEFKRQVKKWTGEFTWPEDIKEIVDGIQNSKQACVDKAESIQKAIEQLKTDDLFYIVVFPTSDGYVYHSKLPDQLFVSLNRGNCNVFVYRSLEAKSADKNELKKMETQLNGYKKLLRLLTLKLFVTQAQVDKWAKEEIDNNGFVIAIKASRDATVLSTNTDVLKWGPGWWIHDTVILLLLQQKYIILCGYK
ncbi:unnamed protein product [Caenorhabditis sp. 36 PRJEB53466]|nr:unnamed protein product [Caenorhabditis sp. 36 PRJEB53466]